MIDRFARRGFDGRTSSQWSQIQQELRYISNVYGFGYGGYGRDDDWRRDVATTATIEQRSQQRLVETNSIPSVINPHLTSARYLPSDRLTVIDRHRYPVNPVILSF